MVCSPPAYGLTHLAKLMSWQSLRGPDDQQVECTSGSSENGPTTGGLGTGRGGGGKRGRGQREISCFPVMVGGEEWVDGR